MTLKIIMTPHFICGVESIIRFHYISYIILVLYVIRTSMDPYDSEQMARDFLIQFSNQVFTVGQQLAFSFQEKKVLSLIVKNLEGSYHMYEYKFGTNIIVTKCYDPSCKIHVHSDR